MCNTPVANQHNKLHFIRTDTSRWTSCLVRSSNHKCLWKNCSQFPSISCPHTKRHFKSGRNRAKMAVAA